MPLSETEYQKLIDKYGKSITNEYIEKVSSYCQSSGKKYKDYYATILNWIKRDTEKAPSLVMKNTSYSIDDIKKKLNNFD